MRRTHTTGTYWNRTQEREAILKWYIGEYIMSDRERFVC